MPELKELTDKQLETKISELTQEDLMVKLNAIISLLGMIAANTISNAQKPEDTVLNNELTKRIKKVVIRGLEGLEGLEEERNE